MPHCIYPKQRSEGIDGPGKKIRDAERRAIECVAGLTNSLMLAHYFVEDSIAYQGFVGELLAGNPNALGTMQSLQQDIEALDAMRMVLVSLKNKIAVDTPAAETSMN